MGDEVLQAIVGNVGEMAVSDCHQAIQATLNRESSDLSGDVVLVAESYGAFIAASLAAKYPAWYKTLILKDPLVDLSATAQSDQLLYWLLGAGNYTEGEVPDSDLLNEAWDRSPVSVMSSIEANTLIFVGKDHRELVPQRQGTALYKSLKSRGFNAALYEFPGGGGGGGGGVSEEGFVFERSVEWIWRYGAPSIKFYEECMEDVRTTTTTDRNNPPTTATTDVTPSPSSSSRNSTPSTNFVLSALALGAMQIFTLTVWAHFKMNVV